MVEVQNIQKKYQKQSILTDCSFFAKPGECIGIVGANGCGKTTLLSILAGAQRADSGVVKYYGEDAFHSKNIFQKFIGYVPQENPLIPELSVVDNLRLWYYGNSNLDAIDYCLQEFSLQEHKKKQVAKLSGGLKRRLSIACAMVNMPPILILDEPCVAVDLVCKAQIHQYLESYKKKNGIILMTTHDESEIRLCSRIYFMDQGVLSEVDRNVDLEKLILQTLM